MLKVFAIALKKLKSKVEKKASDMLRKSQKEKWRMIVLLAIKGYEEKYRRIRTAIFENRKLALEILRLMADEQAMDEASQLIKEAMEINMEE